MAGLALILMYPGLTAYALSQGGENMMVAAINIINSIYTVIIAEVQIHDVKQTKCLKVHRAVYRAYPNHLPIYLP